MRVLLTGAEGYIGARLREHLLLEGFDVQGFDAGFFAEDSLYPAAGPPSKMGDIRRLKQQDLDGFEAVIHLAELSNDPLGQLDPELTREINVGGTAHLAQMAREAGLRRFIYFSSCSVYGAAGYGCCGETAETSPLTEYARAKLVNERYLVGLASDGFSPVIMRNATVYGPSPRMRFDLLVNNLAGMAHTGRRIELISDGSPRRPLIHIEDLCRATEIFLRAPAQEIAGEIFNVGSDRDNYRVIDVAQAVARRYPGTQIVTGAPADARSYWVSFSKIRQRLGFEPVRTLDEGIDELARLFDRVGLTRDRFESPCFTRLRQILRLREQGRLDARLYWTQGGAWPGVV